MEYNRPYRVPEFAVIARLLGCEDRGLDDDELSHLAVDAVSRINRDIGIPTSLKDIGLGNRTARWVAGRALQSRRLVDNNPRPLDEDSLEEITAAAIAGDRSRLETATIEDFR
jgi:alcohol dehydrogenase class IV